MDLHESAKSSSSFEQGEHTFVYGMHKNGSCSKKYKRKAIMPDVVIPSLSGMEFGMLAKLGQMAVSKTAMHWPPVVVWTLCASQLCPVMMV